MIRCFRGELIADRLNYFKRAITFFRIGWCIRLAKLRNRKYDIAFNMSVLFR